MRDRRLAAVCFDMDGLLFDSEVIWSIAERELYESLGGTWGPDIKALCVGQRVDVMVAQLIARAGSDAEPEPARARLEARVADLFRVGLPEQPGARALLESLHRAQVPLALVSSTPRPLVESALTGLGRHWFQVMVTGEEVAHPKPDPEPYLLAARRLEVEATACLAFEDSPAGVTSALAAGCRVIGVPSTVAIAPRPGLTLVESLEKVDLDQLLAEFEPRPAARSRPDAATGADDAGRATTLRR